MFFLKQSTAKDIKLGPFVDKGDGVTYETGMAAAMDHADTGVRLSKNGAAFADRHEGTEPSYDAFGYYLVKLDTTDTDTVGTLKVIFGAAATCLPCEANFQVVEEAIFDSLFAASAAGFDANQRVNVGQWLSQAVTLSTGNKPDVNIDEISDDATAPATLELFVEALDQATGQLDSGTLHDDTITAASINTGALTADAFAADAIVAATLATGAITADAFAADAIVAATLATGALTADAFAADALVAATFATNCITTDALADNTITAAKVADGAIDAATFAAGAINAAAIADAAIDQATFAADVYVSSNVKKVNDVALTGNGTALTPWGPA